MEQNKVNGELEEQINFVIDKRFNINAKEYEKTDIAEQKRITDSKDRVNDKNEILNAINNLESRLDKKIDGVEGRLDKKIDGVEGRLDKKIDGVKGDLEKDILGIKWWTVKTMGGLLALTGSLIVGAIKLIPTVVQVVDKIPH